VSVRDCLLNIFAANASYLKTFSSIRGIRTQHAVVTMDPNDMDEPQ
jgi:hypothetical protein